MAFNIANFAPLGNSAKPIKSIASGALGVGAPSLYSYITEDATTVVDAASYFNGGTGTPYGGVYNTLNIGDIIFVVVCSAGAVSGYGTYIVVDKASGAIDVTNVTPGTMTDSR